jgi:Reverse transcriptase (RNA-dependent DNA polymerase)
LFSTKHSASPYALLHDKEPDWLNNLHRYGELAIVHNGADANITAKLQDCGLAAMFVGYPDSHAGEFCQFLILMTKNLISSRAAIFLHKTYADYYKLAQDLISNVKSNEDNIDVTSDKQQTPEEDPAMDIDPVHDLHEPPPFHHLVDDLPHDPNHPLLETDDESEHMPNISNRGFRELLNLQTSYNPDPLQYTQHAALLATFQYPPKVALQATIYDGSPDPKSYAEAMTSPDHSNWWEAKFTEFDNKHSKGVWTIIPKSDVPSNRKVLGNRWVFVQKDDGRFQARTVAKGFSQIPGKDFQENHSPVVNDTTFHCILALKILLKLEAGQFDIETAFLYGDLEETLWMELPDGHIEYLKELYGKGQHYVIPTQLNQKVMDITTKTHCCKLKKAIYGLVQAAHQWRKKFKEVLLQMGYKPSLADPCLFYQDNPPRSFIIIYVDDGGIFSDDETNSRSIKGIEQIFQSEILRKVRKLYRMQID